MHKRPISVICWVCGKNNIRELIKQGVYVWLPPTGTFPSMTIECSDHRKSELVVIP